MTSFQSLTEIDEGVCRSYPVPHQLSRHWTRRFEAGLLQDDLHIIQYAMPAWKHRRNSRTLLSRRIDSLIVDHWEIALEHGRNMGAINVVWFFPFMMLSQPTRQHVTRVTEWWKRNQSLNQSINQSIDADLQ